MTGMMIERAMQALRRKTGSRAVVALEQGGVRKQSDAQLRYLSHATFLEEAGTPKMLAGVAIAGCLCVAAFVGWATFTRITEVSHAPGEVVPSGFEQVVQHLDGGIVRRIEAKPGDLVQKGQLLLVVDDGSTTENLERARTKLVHLELSAARLGALYDTTLPDWSSVRSAKPGDIQNQTNLFNSAMEEQLGRERIVQEQIEQKKTAATILEGQLATALKNKTLSGNILQARKELHAKQLLAYPVYARAQQDFNQIDGEVSRLNDQIKQNAEALTELGRRLDAIRHSARLETSSRLSETTSEVQQLKASIESLHRRFERLELRSPVRGLVKSVNVNTIGGVLPAGQTVMTIVPVDDDLVVELQVSPRDIGHVRVGQSVYVKVSAYDFSRYGVVNGTLERISAGSFTDRNGAAHYRARARLASSYVGSDTGNNRILPGMTVMADIQTGEKTVLDYLLKPVKATAMAAFNER